MRVRRGLLLRHLHPDGGKPTANRLSAGCPPIGGRRVHPVCGPVGGQTRPVCRSTVGTSPEQAGERPK